MGMKKTSTVGINGNPYDFSGGDSIRKLLARIFIALCVMAVGVGYLGNYVPFLPWEHFTLFFPGWGALFLIVPSVWALIRWPFSWFWPICLLGGILILMSKWEVYPVGTCVAIVLAVLVILIGLRILFAPLFRRLRRRRWRKQWTGNMGSETVTQGDPNADYSVCFGAKKVVMSGQEFVCATLNVSFGELTLDLTDALVKDNSVIDAMCAFGALNIRLPEQVRVELRNKATFGDINGKHKNPENPGAPVVYINADCSFGEIKIV